MTPPRVWALAAQTSTGFRRAQARERRRDSFWPLPLAAFSFCVACPALAGGQHAADPGALTVAMALVTASLIVFLGYVAATMRLLQVTWVITRVDHRRLGLG